MIKAVIFDYGGVFKKGQNLLKYISEIYNISPEEFVKHREKTRPILSKLQRGFIGEEEFWREFSNAIGKPQPKNCMEMSREIYRKTFLFFPEMFDFVKDLSKKGIKTAILSNILGFQAEIIEENKGYEGFDFVLLSHEQGMEKPEIDFYKLAVQKIGVKPEECIFIDDKEKNLLPADSLGMKTVLAKDPEQIIKDVSDIINFQDK